MGQYVWPLWKVIISDCGVMDMWSLISYVAKTEQQCACYTNNTGKETD